jgi:DNA-binding XRE family transcriptional regulator
MLQILNDQSTNYIPNDTGYYKEDIVLVSQRRPPEFVRGASERLKKVRIALGLSQVDFCKKLEIKTRAYSQWETGVQLIDPLICAKISQKFSIPMDYIYTGNELGLPEQIKTKI